MTATTPTITGNELNNELLDRIYRRYGRAAHIQRVNVVVARARGRVVRSANNGTPDLLGTICGHSVALEGKAGTDRLSKEQRLWRDAHLRAGGIFIEARDVDTAMRELEFALEGRHG